MQSRDFYSLESRKRLVELLEDKKTQEEYELHLKYCKMVNLGYSESFLSHANYIMQQMEIQNDTILEQIRDSLFTTSVTRSANRSFEYKKIERELIRMIGYLGLEKSIPILERKLETVHLIPVVWDETSYPQGEPEKSYRYALARLGNEEQRQYILDNLMDIREFDREDFLYFRDDEMIWRYIEVNYCFDKKIIIVSPGDGILYSLKTMNDIYPFVKNVPEELKYYPDKRIRGMDMHNQWSKDFYEWLMENREKIEFDYDGEKKWFW